jgi:hypothetical protein
MLEGSGILLKNDSSQLECQKEVVVCIEKCYRSIGILEGSSSDLVRHVTGQLEC